MPSPIIGMGDERSAATSLIWSTTPARPGWVEVIGGLLSLAAVHGVWVW